MAKAPRGERLIISLIGRRNAGKSSLINAIIKQQVSIVSSEAGTTTDAVAKSYELIPVGPVTFYDTAGIDDVGHVGEKRIKATMKVLFRTDICIHVVDEKGITDDDKFLFTEFKRLDIPFLLVFNKTDLVDVSENYKIFCDEQNINYTKCSTTSGAGIDDVRNNLIKLVPKFKKDEKVLVGDLLNPGDTAVLVAPIDLAAPKGRLILPQVQVLREILDNDAIGMIVKEKEIEEVFNRLKNPPDLVITDSQVVLKVAGDVPDNVKFTTFSILFARYKGDLEMLVNGAEAIDDLEDGDKILIAEACSHHVQSDDIGRVKIPRWINQYTGSEIEFDVFNGFDFPENLEQYKIIIHCGACMLNQVEMQRRIREAQRRGVAITNYGVAISKLQGVLERTLSPFDIEI